MTQDSNDRRFASYVEAIRDEVDHGDVTCTDAARAVMALADAEQAELCAALDLTVRTIARMLDGDADVARALGMALPDNEEDWPDYLADGLVDTAKARMAELRGR